MEPATPVGASRRRRFLCTGASFALGAAIASVAPQPWFRWLAPAEAESNTGALEDLARRVVPREGSRTSVSFGEALLRLIDAGAIDPGKVERLYAPRGGMPAWVKSLLARPSAEPILFSPDTAAYLLNLLWPLGLATKATFNETSPLNGPGLAGFASTGGWVLGRADNGAAYFNKVDTVRLDEGQERAVLEVARTAYRPCCNNSTLFQDCNHGSALLGLLELAGSQGHSRAALYRLALVANSYWYPDQYIEIALYFREFGKLAWKDVPPEVALSPRFSSSRGWEQNVHRPLQRANLLPSTPPQSRCSV